MKIAPVLAILVLVTAPAFGQSVGEKTGVNSALGIASTTADFVKEAATSDMLEIKSSQIAKQKGTPAEQTFADQMIADHTKTSTELKELVSNGAVQAQIPTDLDSSAQSKLDKLNESQPDKFAKTYSSMQVSAHKDAVSLFERYARGGENAKLKDWAGKTLPALQHHLQMAQDLDKK